MERPLATPPPAAVVDSTSLPAPLSRAGASSALATSSSNGPNSDATRTPAERWRERWANHPKLRGWHAKTMLRRLDAAAKCATLQSDSSLVSPAADGSIVSSSAAMEKSALMFTTSDAVSAEVILLFTTLCRHATIEVFSFEPRRGVATVQFGTERIASTLAVLFGALSPTVAGGVPARRTVLQMKGSTVGRLLQGGAGVQGVVDVLAIFGPVEVMVIDPGFHLRIEFTSSDGDIAAADAAACLRELQLPLAHGWSILLSREPVEAS